MLYVFSGNDAVGVRKDAHAFIETYEVRGVPVERITSENYSAGQILELAFSRPLFGEEVLVVLDTPSEEEGMFEECLSMAQALAEAPHTFVVLEKKLSATENRTLKKHAKEYHDVQGEILNERFNTFSLADALSKRDKKLLWVLYMRAKMAGIAPEEIIGVLFWQVKSLRLAQNTKSAGAAGMKDFQYRKVKSAAAKFSTSDLNNLSRSLIDIYHKGHRGEVDIETALEKFLLTV